MRFLGFSVAMAMLPVMAMAQQAKVALTPPMGWNSWDSYGLTITEPQFRDNVTVQKEKLLPSGWNYSVIDEGWYFENPQDRNKPDTLRYAMDGYGRYVPAPERFPSAIVKGAPAPVQSAANGQLKLAATIEDTSFTALGDWVHAQGLKFGIHIIRGIPKAAVERNLPIWTPAGGTSFHASEAADQTDVCPWDPTSWGVRDNAAGQAWYDSLLHQYAGWGVDFIKVDCISNHPYKLDEIEMIRRAINKTGRPMVLSLSPGPTSLDHAAEVVKLANMWRIADDHWDVWDSGGKPFPQGTKDQFERLNAWSKYARPGAWPDADMLPIGALGPHPGWGKTRASMLTPDEVKTELTLWSIGRSPMILGANLTQMDAPMLALLTNRDLIAVSQKATESAQVMHEGGLIVWKAKLPEDQVALAVFNVGDTSLKVDRRFAEFGSELGAQAWRVHDVWAGKDMDGQSGVSMEIAPHACVLLMLRKGQ